MAFKKKEIKSQFAYMSSTGLKNSCIKYEYLASE